MKNFFSGPSSVIHQHQSLVRVHSDVLYSFSLPSALLDHPTRRHFNVLIVNMIGGYSRMNFLETFKALSRNSCILKQTPCVSSLVLIRQFTSTNFDHCIP